MTDITVVLRSGKSMTFKDRRYARGIQTLRFEGQFAVIRRWDESELAIPVDRVQEARVTRRKD